MIRHLLFVFVWTIALALAGCGASSQGKYPNHGDSDEHEATIPSGSAARGAMPMQAMDHDGDAVMDEEDVAYAENVEAPPVSADRRVAQAAPPPPDAPPAVPTPPKAKKSQPEPVPGSKAKPQARAGGGAGKAGSTSGGKTIAAPMLIYTADVNLAVFETEKILDNVEKLAKDAGGYLVERQARRIVIRVPSRDFDGTMLQIAELGDVLHKNVSVEDVTEEYFDLQVRIRNLQVVRDRLEQLLKKADKVPDAIAVERELERVTTQLERLKGRMKLIGELVRFSTITVNVSPRHTEKVGSKVRLPFPWLNTLGLGGLLRL